MAITSLFAMVPFCMADSLQIPAMKSALVSNALLADSAKAGARVVAAGAYGNIVYSVPTEDGKALEWRQANSPTQRLLTTVTFIDDREGWAGGHDTLILHTTDGGENWEIQYEDLIPGNDVPKPVLDIVFTDKRHGIAVGAFSLMLETDDGGKTWAAVDTGALYDRLEEQEQEPEPNFNAIIKLSYGEDYLIVGELGTILLYNPNAESNEAMWRIVKSPYAGSFFGAKELSSGEILIYGLRGHVYRSADQGLTWSQINTGTVASVNDTFEKDDGEVILVGGAGSILRLPKNAVATEKMLYPGLAGFTSVEDIGNDRLMLFGTIGVQIFSLK